MLSVRFHVLRTAAQPHACLLTVLSYQRLYEGTAAKCAAYSKAELRLIKVHRLHSRAAGHPAFA